MYLKSQPFIALVAGILILLFPRLLNYIVAVYLIAIGILGLTRMKQDILRQEAPAARPEEPVIRPVNE
jgi:hypothetical protein